MAVREAQVSMGLLDVVVDDVVLELLVLGYGPVVDIEEQTGATAGAMAGAMTKSSK